ncbi:MAG: pyrroline-5-carboxylate reductase [Kiritimatiellia bacterium]
MSDENSRGLLFIGAGNMAEAMIRGIVKTGVFRKEQITVSDIDPARLEHFERELGIKGSSDNRKSAAAAGIICLAVKPQQAATVLQELAGFIPDDALLISIVTGFTTKKIASLLGKHTRIIRVVPNTPALVGSGASAYFCGRGTTDEDAHMAESILKSTGIAIRIEEPQMNAVTALSGSGPAYVFYLVEAMIEAGREVGLSVEDTRKLVIATVTGSAHLLLETGIEPGELRRRVTSRGGTTEAALEVLNKKGVNHAVVAAVKAAHRRARELSA